MDIPYIYEYVRKFEEQKRIHNGLQRMFAEKYFGTEFLITFSFHPSAQYAMAAAKYVFVSASFGYSNRLHISDSRVTTQAIVKKKG